MTMDQKLIEVLERQNPWWFGKEYDRGIARLKYYPYLLKYADTEEILLILGARRTGKSTLMYQIIDSLQVPGECILYVNLDEPILQSMGDDSSLLLDIIEYHVASAKQDRYYIFIDEVQNYDYWDTTLKSLYDTDKRLKFILTGSTSGLLRRKTITRLSGRYLINTVYPLTFREYLDFKGLEKITSAEKKHEFRNYLRFGAFPRIALEDDLHIKEELLKNYYETIYLKDIIFPHRLRDNRDLADLLYFIISNIGKPFSYNSMSKALGISADTVKEYLGYAEESYLIHTLSKFDYSVKKQIQNPRKVYCIDTGLVNSVSFSFSENYGRLLENIVFMELMRRDLDVYYHRNSGECDFVTVENKQVTGAIQVTSELNVSNEKREIQGLISAMTEYNLNHGLILTDNTQDTIEKEGMTITVRPVWKWLLD